MKQYLEHLIAIQEKGTYKPAAREGMPGTKSLFGYQSRYNLQDGFPAVTTKKLYWKGVVVELLWFLSGDTNIKTLDQQGVRKMWHEDAYNYYVKIASKNTDSSWNAIYIAINEKGEREIWTDQTKATNFSIFTFSEFCEIIQNNTLEQLKQYYSSHDYTLGDCGAQYGQLWRKWDGGPNFNIKSEDDEEWLYTDQLHELIEGLRNNPNSRRHIITAWNPATLENMALNACHILAQWNCRPLTEQQKHEYWWFKILGFIPEYSTQEQYSAAFEKVVDQIPNHYLDCQMYQRSADMFLGVPLNVASYALLTEILCKVCNMIPGDFIHTFGDSHIYDNHQDQVKELLSREPKPLPKLRLPNILNKIEFSKETTANIINLLVALNWEDFKLENYQSHPPISGELSTGLKK